MSGNGKPRKLGIDGRDLSNRIPILLLPPHVRRGMEELLRAYEYAQSARCDLWDFAVEIGTLRELGLRESDFRWLICMDYVEHGREITRRDEHRRRFLSLGKLSFTKRTCFIPTANGVAVAQQLRDESFDRGCGAVVSANGGFHRESVGHGGKEASGSRVVDSPSNGKVISSGSSLIPLWDGERRELRVNDTLVKRFKWPALNQEMVLMAFQEEHWPARIDDPLPPQPEQDPKRRLHDTIKCLNRHQGQPLIRFHGDGTGEGVLWDLVVNSHGGVEK